MNKILIIFTCLAGLMAGVLFFVFYPIANFPKPKGHYGVGLTKYHWVDLARKELNSHDPKYPNREIMVYCFYPTEKNETAKPVAYDQDAVKNAMEYLAGCSKLPEWLFSGIKLIKTHAQPNAPFAKSTIPFPVIIFSHGAPPMVQQYTWMLEDLASHGFVVVGINHPYVAGTVRYPDGRVVASIYREKAHDAQGKLQLLETNVQDVSFAINKIAELHANKDEFWGKFDLNKIGLFGHSFGGRTTLRAIRRDTRIKCGINLDGGAQDEDIVDNVSKPFLFLCAEKGRNSKDFLEMIQKLAAAKDSKLKIVIIKEIGHVALMDTPLQLNMTLFGRFISRFADFGLVLPAEKATDVLVNTVMPNIVNFFDEQLKDKKN